MTREEKIALLELLDERDRRKPVWTPQPPDPERQWPEGHKSPQQLAFESKAQIIGFGGSLGGGKTDLGIGMGLMHHSRGLIVRRNYSDLDTIKKRFESLLGYGCVKKGDVYEVRVPEGRNCTATTIRLGHASDPEAETVEDRYQGQEYDYIFIDELTHFLKSTKDYLLTRCRTSKKGQISQMVVSFNPPTKPEQAWVIDEFAPWLDKRHSMYGKVKYGQVLYKAAIAREDEDRATIYWFEEFTVVTHHPTTGEPLREPIETVSVTFIRSELDDNAYLKNTDYKQRVLSMNDARLSRILLYGEFTTDFDDLDVAIFKPQHWRVCAERFKQLQANNALPTGRPDVIAIDAALGGNDFMNVQHAHLPGIYLPQHRVSGKKVPSQAAQIEWLRSIPLILDSRLYVVDCDGGYGQGIYEWLCDEMEAQGSPTHCVIAHKGAVNNKWSMPSWDKSGEGGGWAAQTFQHDTAAAWAITGRSMEFTDAAVPDDPDLTTQVLSRRFTTLSPYLGIERKEDYVKRLGRSPDDADALCMAGLGLHCWLEVFGRP